MYDLYVLLPPRHGEYRELRVWKDKTMKPDNNSNYLDLRNRKSPRIFLNIYKGSKKKGQYVIDNVPPSLVQFARDTHAQHGMYVFRRGLRSSASWSKYIGDMFESLLKKRVGINILRKSYTSYLFQNDPHMSEAKKMNIAHAMGTSVQKLQLVYRKV